MKHSPISGTGDERTRLHTFLLSCGIIGIALFSVVNFTFAAVSPNYDIARQGIAELQQVPHGWVQSINFVVLGLFMFAFAIGLRKELVSGFGAVSIPLLQAIAAFGPILSGIILREPIHTSAAVFSFVVLLLGFFVIARRFAADPRWKGWAAYSIICGLLMILLLAMFIYSQSHNGNYAGLYERGVLLARAVWTLFFTVRLLAGVRLGPVGEV